MDSRSGGRFDGESIISIFSRSAGMTMRLMRYHLALSVSHMASIIGMRYPFGLVRKPIIVQRGQLTVYGNVDESGLAATKL